MFITARINRSQEEFAELLKALAGACSLKTTNPVLLEHYCHRLRVLLCPEPPKRHGWQACAVLPVRFTRETLPILYRYAVHMDSLGLGDSIAPILDIARSSQLKQIQWSDELLAQATFADWLDAYYDALDTGSLFLLAEALDSLTYYGTMQPSENESETLRAQFTKQEHDEFIESQRQAFNLLGELDASEATKPLANLALLGTLDELHGFFEGFSGDMEIDPFTDQYFALVASNLDTDEQPEEEEEWEI